MKTRYAIYKNIPYGYHNIEEAGYSATHEDFVRVSEYVEADFIERKPEDVVPIEIQFLEKAKEAVRVEYKGKEQKIDEKIARLRAITHQP